VILDERQRHAISESDQVFDYAKIHRTCPRYCDNNNADNSVQRGRVPTQFGLCQRSADGSWTSCLPCSGSWFQALGAACSECAGAKVRDRTRYVFRYEINLWPAIFYTWQ